MYKTFYENRQIQAREPHFIDRPGGTTLDELPVYGEINISLKVSDTRVEPLDDIYNEEADDAAFANLAPT